MSTIRARLARLQERDHNARPFRALYQVEDEGVRRPSDEEFAAAIAEAEAAGFRPHCVRIRVVRATPTPSPVTP